MEGLLFIAVLAVGAAVAVFAYRHNKKRREAIQQQCAEHGWEYRRRDNSWASNLAAHFPLFRRGFGRQCNDVVIRQRDGGIDAAFDYLYKERRGSGRDRRTVTYRYAVAVTTLPAFLPGLRIDSESFLTKIAGMAGFRGVETESDDFNRRFRVNAKDRTHAFDILHPRTIDFLLQQSYDNWELDGRYLVVTRRGKWGSGDYAAVFGKLESFLGLIPDYVWRKHAPETG